MPKHPKKKQRRRGFNPLGSGYDFETARKFGITPDATGHWPSRAPNGQILKGIRHPTFNKTVAGERKAGYQFYMKNGKIYTRKIR